MTNAFKQIVGGSIGAQLVVVCAGLILARVYDPAAFGELGFYASIAALVSVVSGLRLDHIAFSESSKNKHAQYLNATLLNALASAAIATGILTLANQLDLVRPLSPAIAFSYTLATSCYYLFGQFDLYSGNYQRFARIRFIQSALYATIPALFLPALGQIGLTLGVATSMAAACIYYYILTRKVIFTETKSYIPLLSSKWREAISNTGTTLLQYSTPFAPVIIGSGFAEKSEVGAYFLFTQMIAAPFSLVRRALINYFNATLSQPASAKACLMGNRRIILISIGALVIGSTAISAIIHLFGADIIKIAIGERWVGMTSFLLPMVVYFTFDALLQPVTTLLPHWGASKTLFRLELLRFVLVYLIGSVLIMLLSWSFFQYSIFFFASMLVIYSAEAAYAGAALRRLKHE